MASMHRPEPRNIECEGSLEALTEEEMLLKFGRRLSARPLLWVGVYTKMSEVFVPLKRNAKSTLVLRSTVDQKLNRRIEELKSL